MRASIILGIALVLSGCSTSSCERHDAHAHAIFAVTSYMGFGPSSRHNVDIFVYDDGTTALKNHYSRTSACVKLGERDVRDLRAILTARNAAKVLAADQVGSICEDCRTLVFLVDEKWFFLRRIGPGLMPLARDLDRFFAMRFDREYRSPFAELYK